MEHIQVANAPCSWGSLEFDLDGSSPEPARVLDEIAQTGYAGTELGDWGFLPTAPVELRHAVEDRGLVLVAAFVPVALADAATHGPGRDVALKTARLLAAVHDGAVLVLADDNGHDPIRTRDAGRIRPDQGLTNDQWSTFTEGAQGIAKAVWEATGVRTVFHPHCAGFVETPDEIEAFLSRTDPETMGLCLDTGHVTYGGGDALELLEKYLDRIWHVHFKDCDLEVASRCRSHGWDYFKAVSEGLFCELGHGVVNFPEIIERLKDRSYRGWVVVEQDVLPGMGTPRESARRNRSYLARLHL